MQLTFLGAAREVTGSAHLLTANNKQILIDCGMQQGSAIYERQELTVDPNKVDVVLLTHAHIDHSGLLPLLVKRGFRGKIVCTSATLALCRIMLADSAHIQEQEAQWKSRKAKRRGDSVFEPLYDSKDVEMCLRLFETVEYMERIEISEGVVATFYDAGHLLGSSIIELKILENKERRTVVFSGDLGPQFKPLLNSPPENMTGADYLVIESTYGDRMHKSRGDFVIELAEIIQRVMDRGGNLVIPAFAVGRTQELLYYIRKVKEQKLVVGHDHFPVVVDSPLAIEATNVYNEKTVGYFDSEALGIIEKGGNPIAFPGLQCSVTEADSRAINYDKTPKVIISASGMCEAGRIRHHLKYNLWRKDSAVLFVGYQVEGTLGSTLIRGANYVKLFNEEVVVNAEIINVDSLSSHADQSGLLNWIRGFEKKPQRVFAVHGESHVAEDFANTVSTTFGIPANAPYYTETFDLISGERVKEGMVLSPRQVQKMNKNTPPVYQKLLLVGERISRLIGRYRSYTNHDIKRLTKQLEDIANRAEQID